MFLIIRVEIRKLLYSEGTRSTLNLKFHSTIYLIFSQNNLKDLKNQVNN